MRNSLITSLKNVPLILSFVILLILFTFVSIQAELADRIEMDRVCQNWLTQMTYEKGTWAGDINPLVESTDELMAGDTLLAIIYNISPNGFIVVPILKEMMPIKAYSDESTLDENQEDGFLLLLKETLSARMNLFAKTYGSFNAVQPSTGDAVFGQGQKSHWDRLILPADKFESELNKNGNNLKLEAGPLLVSSWHQRSPYNDLCPEGDGGRTVVGCVATATAQIINYWQWPVSGVGSYSYYWNGDQSCDGDVGGGTQTADFSDEYDWTHMIDSCDDGCLPDDSSALAELSREVGVAFNMNYGACGSGASTARALQVFPTFFKYSAEIEKVDRINYDQADWFAMVQEEIDNSRPIQYRIRSHSIVCDGWREQIGGQYEYHMNYGWGNGFSTWYIFDSLYCYWVEPDSVCPYEEEFMITHIYPQTEPIVRLLGNTINDNNGGDGDGVAEINESIELTSHIENNGWDAVNTIGTLTTDDPFISITTAETTYDDSIPWGEESYSQTPMIFSVDPSCPDPHIAMFILITSAGGGYTTVDTIYVYIGTSTGFQDDIESGAGYWTHQPVEMMFGDEWHIENYNPHNGTYSWKAGGLDSNDYSSSVDGGLITPPFLLPSGATLSFWHRISTETGWDGAIVMLSSGDGQWSQIYPEGGYPYTITDNPANALEGGTPCYSGYQDWSQAQFDLSAYSGVAQIMFRFASDAAVTDEGWYIDDVIVEGFLCGDFNNSVLINILDITYAIAYLYKAGPAPVSEWAADPDGNGSINILDITFLINYLYKGGPEPVCE